MINSPLFESQSFCLAALDEENDAEILSDWTMDLDVAEVFRGNDPPRPMNPAEVKKWIHKSQEAANESGTQFIFAVREKDTDRLIGLITFPWVSWSNSASLLKLVFESKSAIQKYGREIFQVSLQYAFIELNLYRVTVGVAAYREDLLALVKAFGFTQEVCMRALVFREGEYWDYLRMGLVCHEWQNPGKEVQK
jgi:RimJ/RimL family protein N-acetyltransferase